MKVISYSIYKKSLFTRRTCFSIFHFLVDGKILSRRPNRWRWPGLDVQQELTIVNNIHSIEEAPPFYIQLVSITSRESLIMTIGIKRTRMSVVCWKCYNIYNIRIVNFSSSSGSSWTYLASRSLFCRQEMNTDLRVWEDELLRNSGLISSPQ